MAIVVLLVLVLVALAAGAVCYALLLFNRDGAFTPSSLRYA